MQKRPVIFLFGFTLLAAVGCGTRLPQDRNSNDEMTVRMLKDWSTLSKDSPWQNSLGMKLVPVSHTEVLFSIWLTRISDYGAFASGSANVDASWRKQTEPYGLPINESPEHPVCNVSWEDAKNFCQWLSSREQASGLISAEFYYRLPTDIEWSAAVGLLGEKGATPEEKHKNAQLTFPWGNQWPPLIGAGNFADETLHTNNSIYPRIVGYNDGFATTSPVGSFAPNIRGLFDMSGNLLEWCYDEYSPGGKLPTHLKGARPLRGGAWTSVYAETLTSGHRHYENPKVRYHYYGFRVVLAKRE